MKETELEELESQLKIKEAIIKDSQDMIALERKNIRARLEEELSCKKQSLQSFESQLVRDQMRLDDKELSLKLAEAKVSALEQKIKAERQSNTEREKGLASFERRLVEQERIDQNQLSVKLAETQKKE